MNEIAESETVDRTLHRVISFEPAESAEENGRIVKRLKRGFTWHDRVLRAGRSDREALSVMPRHTAGSVERKK